MRLEDLVSGIDGFSRWTQADKIRLFGWYLHVHEGRRRFSTADLRTCYDSLHIQDPDSFSPFFKGMKGQLLEDSEGMYLERSVRESVGKRFELSEGAGRVSALLGALPGKISDPNERGFIEEAIKCVRAGAKRAAIVLGWCAVIERFRSYIQREGFDKFNQASMKLKNETSGKFKRWTKGVQANSYGELLAVFDTDLIVVLEGMQAIDGNEAKRLETMFEWRCQCAHPAVTPIDDPHVEAFFSDAVQIVLAHPRFHQQ